MLEATPARLMTATEFWAFAALPENADKRLELIDGVIVEMASSSQKNTVIAMRVGFFLNGFVIPRNIGYVTGADGGFTINDWNAYQPDVGYISKARHPELGGVEFPVPPDLAVEVISPSESSLDVQTKVERYLAAGSQLVWTVYEKTRQVRVWQLGAEGQITMQVKGITDTLDGGNVLPGFMLKVSEIFP
jgi:Uma2 family endonuclease